MNLKLQTASALAAFLVSGGTLLSSVPAAAATHGPRAILVCNGTAPGGCPAGTQAAGIQQAVNMAAPGDWVLVWPGVYHEKGSTQAGVSISKAGLHLRGMDRNRVVVDGSNGSASRPCPSDLALQDFNGGQGRNGIEVFKADGTTIENLTVCDYLSSPDGRRGNEIWWNGGDASGQIGMHSYRGDYLTATSMFYQDASSPMAHYGIFVSNAGGPGVISRSYASNMGDSAFYLGACPNCNATLTHVQAENSAVGYSGTNSGGNLRIEHSEWDQNRVGVVPNSLNNDDAPSPQSGQCPSGHGSCTFIQFNHVHDNNNPNTPLAGIAGTAPVGTGIEISGGRLDTVRDNVVDHQGGWGIVVHDFPDSEPPTPLANCAGGVQAGPVCFFNAFGNLIHGNRLSHNGFFGNPTNGDLANEAAAQPKNCFYGNSDPAGLTSDPPMIQSAAVDGPPCDAAGPGDDSLLAGELVCASGAAQCPIPGASYPQPSQVRMLPLRPQQSMPDPCDGAPENAFCDQRSEGHAA